MAILSPHRLSRALKGEYTHICYWPASWLMRSRRWTCISTLKQASVCVCVKAVVQRGCCSSAPPRRGLAVRLQEKLPHIWQSFSVASVLLSWEVYWWLTNNMQWGRSSIYMYITRFSPFKAASVPFFFFFHLERRFLGPDQCKNSVH